MKKYSSGLVSESFWFVEFKKLLKLLREGKDWEDIKVLSLEDNLFGVSNKNRAKRIYGYLKNRIEVLDEDIIDLFMNSDIQTQKVINIIAVAKQNQLFFEFLYEVYREKIILGETELTASDINIFFKNKQDQDQVISKWTDVTFRRLRSSYMNFITEAGLVSLIDKERRITAPIIDISLENYLKDSGQMQILKVIKGAD